MKWITQNFDHIYTGDRNSRDYIAHLYALYGIERIGVASGYKYLGNINWFESGSNHLVSDQKPDGSFGDPTQIWGMNVRNIPGTAFALLFLSNGNAPVVIDKLTYASIPPQKGAQPVPDHWNQRPRDMFNLSHWMSAQTESPLKWNIVTLATPVAELHEAPIVYLAGSLPGAKRRRHRQAPPVCRGGWNASSQCRLRQQILYAIVQRRLLKNVPQVRISRATGKSSHLYQRAVPDEEMAEQTETFGTQQRGSRTGHPGPSRTPHASGRCPTRGT